MGHLYLNPHIPMLKKHHRRESINDVRARDHNSYDCLHKINQVKIPAWMGAGNYEVPSSAEKLLAVDGHHERVSELSPGVCSR